MLDELDPEIAAYCKLLTRIAIPLGSSTVAELRAQARDLRAGWPPGPEMYRSEDGIFEGCRFRVHQPRAAPPSAAIVFLHGGGWTLMDIDTHDAMARGLAVESGAAVIAVDYPLAPEAPFPAALDFCHRFAGFVAQSAEDLGVAGDGLALAGDSAGATLALGVALKLRDGCGSRPAGLGLLYGAYDADMDKPSYRQFGSGELPFSRERMAFFLNAYLPGPRDRIDPDFALLRADLRDLPPSFVAVGSHDALRDDSVLMAERLRAAGCETLLKIYPGAIHGFVEAASAVGAAIAKQALRDCGEFLARALREATQALAL